MPQWDAAGRVPEWETAVYGPVLPDPVILPHPGAQERHCGQPWDGKNSAHPHYCRAQLPGNLPVVTVLLLTELNPSWKTPRLTLIRPLAAVLRLGRVQQRRHASYGWPAVHAAGEDLELLPANQQGANRHPHVAAPQHVGKGLQQSDQRWKHLIHAIGPSTATHTHTGCVSIPSQRIRYFADLS